MRVLSVTAQKPCSTGSGVYLTEVVRSLAKMGVSQAVVAGVTREDRVDMPEGVTVYPVYFSSEKLPYPVVGMSDEMPYTSTRYRDMTEEMAGQFKAAFLEVLDAAIEKENPDIILCHHLYYLTALIRAHYPAKKVYGFWKVPKNIKLSSNPKEHIIFSNFSFNFPSPMAYHLKLIPSCFNL